MTLNEQLADVFSQLTPTRQQQLLDYATYLAGLNDDEWWQLFGGQRMSEAYGDDEPEYSLADCKVLRP